MGAETDCWSDVYTKQFFWDYSEGLNKPVVRHWKRYDEVTGILTEMAGDGSVSV